MRGEIKLLLIILGLSFGISSLALYLLGIPGFIPQFYALSLSDSINPCTFVIYTMLLIALSVRKIDKRQIYIVGSGFILAVYISYYLLGVGLLYLGQYIPLWFAGFLAIAFGIYTIVTGLMEKSRIIDKRSVRKKMFSAEASFLSSFLLGVVVSSTLLPCSAGSYLVYATIIAHGSRGLALILLALYNIIFVLPLVLILLTVGSISESKRFSQALVRHSRELSVVAGMLLIGIGLWVLTGEST